VASNNWNDGGIDIYYDVIEATVLLVVVHLFYYCGASVCHSDESKIEESVCTKYKRADNL
jgi:hypothetical protein